MQLPSPTGGARLYVTERNFSPTPGYRMVARSYNGGNSLTDFGIDYNLTAPVTPHWTDIVASVHRLNYNDTGRPYRIVLSIPGDTKQRANLTMRVSSDGGYSWSRAKTFWSGLGGYTDLVSIGNQYMGVLYENGETTFCDRISFSPISLDWFSDLF